VRSVFDHDEDEGDCWDEFLMTREEREHAQGKLYALLILTGDSIPADWVALIDEYIEYGELMLALETLVRALENDRVPVDRADIADIDELGRLLHLDPNLTDELIVRDAPRDIRDGPRSHP
jgi:hypothetical protein